MNKSTKKVVQIVELFYVLLKTVVLLAGVMIFLWYMYQMLKDCMCPFA
jgi:hypothetical protein